MCVHALKRSILTVTLQMTNTTNKPCLPSLKCIILGLTKNPLVNVARLSRMIVNAALRVLHLQTVPH